MTQHPGEWADHERAATLKHTRTMWWACCCGPAAHAPAEEYNPLAAQPTPDSPREEQRAHKTVRAALADASRPVLVTHLSRAWRVITDAQPARSAAALNAELVVASESGRRCVHDMATQLAARPHHPPAVRDAVSRMHDTARLDRLADDMDALITSLPGSMMSADVLSAASLYENLKTEAARHVRNYCTYAALASAGLGADAAYAARVNALRDAHLVPLIGRLEQLGEELDEMTQYEADLTGVELDGERAPHPDLEPERIARLRDEVIALASRTSVELDHGLAISLFGAPGAG